MLDFIDEELSDSEKAIFKKMVLLQFRGKPDRDIRNTGETLLIEEGKKQAGGGEDAD